MKTFAELPSSQAAIESKWIDITPALAKEMLKKNISNRPLRERTVKAFALEMLNGTWLTTHQGPAFDEAGRLIDGQHKLAAVVMSGCTVRMLVTTGLPSHAPGKELKTMDVIDRGAPRSVANQLKIQHGFTEPSVVAALCAALGGLCLGDRVTRPGVAQTLEIYREFERSIKFMLGLRSKEKGLRQIGALAGFTFALSSEVATDQVAMFFGLFNRGEGLEATAPIGQLRAFVLSPEAALMTRSMNRGLAELTLQAIWLQGQGKAVPMLELKQDGANHFKGLQAARVKKIAALFTLPTSIQSGNAAPVLIKPDFGGNGSAPAPAKNGRPSMTAIFKAGEKHFGVPALLLGRRASNSDDVCLARRSIMRCGEELGQGKREIALSFGWEVNDVTRELAIFADMIKHDAKRAALYAKFRAKW